MQFAGGEEMHRPFAPLRTTGGEDARVERTLLSAAFAVGVVPGVTEIPVSSLSFQKLSLVIPNEVRNLLFAGDHFGPSRCEERRPLREAGKFADINKNREGQTGRERNREGHDFSRAATHDQCPRLQPVRDRRRRGCSCGADTPVRNSRCCSRIPSQT
jgi:hypothetical protein